MKKINLHKDSVNGAAKKQQMKGYLKTGIALLITVGICGWVTHSLTLSEKCFSIFSVGNCFLAEHITNFSSVFLPKISEKFFLSVIFLLLCIFRGIFKNRFFSAILNAIIIY